VGQIESSRDVLAIKQWLP